LQILAIDLRLFAPIVAAEDRSAPWLVATVDVQLGYGGGLRHRPPPRGYDPPRGVQAPTRSRIADQGADAPTPKGRGPLGTDLEPGESGIDLPQHQALLVLVVLQGHCHPQSTVRSVSVVLR